VHTNEKIEQFVDMYIFCDVSLLPNPLQNAQEHQHTCTCKKKTMLFVDLMLCIEKNYLLFVQFDVMHRKQLYFNTLIFLFLTRGVGTSKIFRLKFIIQKLVQLYNKNILS